MNKVILMGRLTRDPEVRYSQGAQGTAIARYTLAVNRSFKREGEPEADFINIVAFGGRGEFAGKYFKKGRQVAVVGELRISSYTDRDGNKRWSTDILAEEQHFADSKKDDGNAQTAPAQQPAYNQQGMGADDFKPIDDEIEGDEDIPF